jgi:hypothetical protein
MGRQKPIEALQQARIVINDSYGAHGKASLESVAIRACKTKATELICVASIQLSRHCFATPDATMQPAPQDNQLMSKHRVLSFKPHLRLEWRGQDGQNETEQPDHSAS